MRRYAPRIPFTHALSLPRQYPSYAFFSTSRSFAKSQKGEDTAWTSQVRKPEAQEARGDSNFGLSSSGEEPLYKKPVASSTSARPFPEATLSSPNTFKSNRESVPAHLVNTNLALTVDAYEEKGKVQAGNYRKEANDLRRRLRLRHTPHIIDLESIPLPPSPHHKTELFNNIVLLRNSINPTVPFPRILEYHTLFPHLHSVHSYNILIGMAIRHSAIHAVKDLFQSMETSGIEANAESAQLAIRSLVRTGKWKQAWDKVLQISQRHPSLEIPLPFLVEFFGSPAAGVERKMTLDRRRKQVTISSRQLSQFPHRMAFDLLVDPSKMVRMGEIPLFRVLHAVIRRLLLMEKRDKAVSLMTLYTSHLQEPLDKKTLENFLSVLHLFIQSKYNCKDFYEAKTTLDQFLNTLHLSISPTPLTLFLLFEHLQRKWQRGKRALTLLESYRQRFGDAVEDEVVRRQVAKYAIQQSRFDIAYTMAMREAEFGTRWRQDDGGTEFDGQGRALMKKYLALYTHNNASKAQWIRMGLIEPGPGFRLKPRHAVVAKDGPRDSLFE